MIRLKTRLGPLSRILDGSRSQSEVLRISRKKGRKPTRNIRRQVGRMVRVAGYAKVGGIVLTGVGLGLACNEIANIDDGQKKNEVLVEAMGGLAGGAVATILLFGTPVGWVAALVVGVGTAVASFYAGKKVRDLYNTYGQKMDIASTTGVTRFCR